MSKKFRVNPQIGKCKNSVSYHDGVKTHKDGSPFYDISIFNRKTDLQKFVKELKQQGYTE